MGAGASAAGAADIPNGSPSPKLQSKPTDNFDVGPIDLGKGENDKNNKSTSYKVTLNDCSLSSDQGLTIPDEFFIRLSYESLDLLHTNTLLPIIQFPYQSIICWGSSAKIFQFNAFPTTLNSNKLKETIKIIVNTTVGKDIDVMTMSKIRALMSDMESRAVSKDEFITLKRLIMLNQYELVEDWYKIVDQFSSTGRMFLAKQGMELMQIVAPLAPFEKHDLALLLYNRILNKESYQLIINVFPDKVDRDNLIHRLCLKPSEQIYTSDCDLLRSPMPSPMPVDGGDNVDSVSGVRGVRSTSSNNLSAAGSTAGPEVIPIVRKTKPLSEINASLSKEDREAMEKHNPSSRMFSTAHLSKDRTATPTDGRSVNFGSELNRSTDGFDPHEVVGAVNDAKSTAAINGELRFPASMPSDQDAAIRGNG